MIGDAVIGNAVVRYAMVGGAAIGHGVRCGCSRIVGRSGIDRGCGLICRIRRLDQEVSGVAGLLRERSSRPPTSSAEPVW